MLRTLGWFVSVSAVLCACASAQRRPFTEALDRDDLGAFEALVRKEGSPNFLVEEGQVMSPLMMAAKRGAVELAARLLALGADPNLEDRQDWTALTHACHERNLQMIRLLVEGGADVHHQGPEKDGVTCLRRVNWLGTHKDEVAIVQLLADAGVDLAAAAARWGSPKQPYLHYLLDLDKPAVVLEYLTRGARSDHLDANGRSLLVLAVAREDLPLVRALLERGLDPRVKDSRGREVIGSARMWLGERKKTRHPVAQPLSAKTYVVLQRAFDPELTSPEQRLAAFDDALENRKELLAARAAQQAAARAREREEERREYEEYMRTRSTAPAEDPAAAMRREMQAAASRFGFSKLAHERLTRDRPGVVFLGTPAIPSEAQEVLVLLAGHLEHTVAIGLRANKTAWGDGPTSTGVVPAGLLRGHQLFAEVRVKEGIREVPILVMLYWR